MPAKNQTTEALSPATSPAAPPAPKFAPAPVTAQESTSPHASAPQISSMFVLDTTAAHDRPPRKHGMQLEGGQVREFEFKPGVPTELPWEIALKFLKHDAFRLTDADGNPIPFRGTPRQPEDLGAGEQFMLAEDEVVARYDELTTAALQMRCAQMPAGESVAKGRDRREMIEFIVRRTLARRVENAQREAKSADEFTPEPEDDDNPFGMDG